MLRYALHRAGLRLTRVAANRVPAPSWLYLPLYPFAALGTLVAFRREKDAVQRELNREIRRQMLSWPVTMGETLVLVAKRE